MDDEKIREELIKEVQELAEKLGRTPRAIDFYKINDVRRYFVTWNNFLIESGLPPNLVVTSFNASKEEVIENLGQELRKIGSQTTTDYTKYKSQNSPSYTQILRITGANSWFDVLEMVGIQPSSYQGRRNFESKKCSVHHCNNKLKSKGYCDKHYQQMRRNGFIKDNKTEEDKQSHIEAMRNKRVNSNSGTGIRGIRATKAGKYKASIVNNYKEIYLGTFDTLEAAMQARMEAEKKYWGKVYSKPLEDLK